MLDINTATSAQLIEWRDGQSWEDAPVGSKDQLDAIILQRALDEKVNVAMVNYKQKEIGRVNDEKALRDWPELKNKESEMYLLVQEEMDKNPNAIKDPNSFSAAALKVGIGMGLTPAGFTPARSGSDPMGSIGGGEGNSGDNGADVGQEFLKKTKDIGKAFEGLIDLTDEKVRARIAARAEEAK